MNQRNIWPRQLARWLIVLMVASTLASVACDSASAADPAAGDEHAVEDLTHANQGAAATTVFPEKGSFLAPHEFKYDLAIYTFIVFLLLVAILWKFAWGPICEGLEKREKMIADNIATAENAAAETKRLTDEYEAKLAGASDEVRQMLDDARRDGEHTAQQIVAGAQAKTAEEGKRMLREVETAKEAALKEISDSAADLAVNLAGQIVSRELNQQDHADLIQKAQAEFLAAKPSSN